MSKSKSSSISASISFYSTKSKPTSISASISFYSASFSKGSSKITPSLGSNIIGFIILSLMLIPKLS